MTEAMYQMNIDTSYAINVCYINEFFCVTLFNNDFIRKKKKSKNIHH